MKKPLPVILFAIIAAFALVLLSAEEGCSDEASPSSSADPAASPGGDAPPVTDVPAADPTPEPAPAFGETVSLSGAGQTATGKVTPPAPANLVTLTHSGESNFIVTVFRGGDQDLMVNKIGSYSGTRYLAGADDVLFDIDADGPWTLTITPVGVQPDAASSFAGRGDAVSGIFDSPDDGAWAFVHDGESNFIVLLHCDDSGQDLIQNEVGPVSGSGIIQFEEDDACIWEVEADGNWSLAKQ